MQRTNKAVKTAGKPKRYGLACLLALLVQLVGVLIAHVTLYRWHFHDELTSWMTMASVFLLVGPPELYRQWSLAPESDKRSFLITTFVMATVFVTAIVIRSHRRNSGHDFADGRYKSWRLKMQFVKRTEHSYGAFASQESPEPALQYSKLNADTFCDDFQT